MRQIKDRSIAAGLYAANMPAELGGGGLDTLGVTLVDREFGAASYALQYIVARPIEHPAGLHRRPDRRVSGADDPR